MSLEVRMESNEDIVRSELGQIISRIPEVEKEFTREMMELAVDEIRKSADKRFNEFSGNMMQQISMNNVNESSSGEGTKFTLDMTGGTPRSADYLGWHENAENGHWVEVSPENAPIQDWADKHVTGDPSFIYVSPTPFVKPAIQRIARRARRKAESEDNAIAELGREV